MCDNSLESDKCDWKVQPSQIAINSVNPISEFMEQIRENQSRDFSCQENGEVIDLSAGNLCRAPQEVIDSLIQTILEGRHNGYAPSVGFENTRCAILDYLKYPTLTPKDIILSSGTTSCMDIAITALADRGQNILIPRPSNPHYKLLAHGLGIETKEYDLMPLNWEVDLIDLCQKIDANTALILINNPHNPTGALYSDFHLQNILDLAHRHRLPVIVDEVYKDLVFPDCNVVSAIEVNTKVPLLVCGGLSKSFMVPGWRVGWILIHDPVDGFEEVRKGLISLSQRIIGCNTVMQGAIVGMVNANVDFRRDFMQSVQDNARMLSNMLDNRYGIRINLGKSIYTMVNVDLERYQNLGSSEEFCVKLYEEQGVVTLPGELFGSKSGFIRIALDLEKPAMEVAVTRIKKFCASHYSS